MAASLRPYGFVAPLLQAQNHHSLLQRLLNIPASAAAAGVGKPSPIRRRACCICSLPWEQAALSLALQQQQSCSSPALLLGASAAIAAAAKTGVQAMAAIWANQTFAAGMVAWAVAQALQKMAAALWGSAVAAAAAPPPLPIPSSDSALCAALTTSVALTHGLSHPLFPVCLGFALIAMYDSAGVRRHAGIQAQVLNLIVEDRFPFHPLMQQKKKLKELLGHTPLQVGAGAVVGILVAYLFSHVSASATFPGRRIL